MNVTLIVGSRKMMNKDTLNVRFHYNVYRRSHFHELLSTFLKKIILKKQNGKPFHINYYCSGNYFQTVLTKKCEQKSHEIIENR